MRTVITIEFRAWLEKGQHPSTAKISAVCRRIFDLPLLRTEMLIDVHEDFASFPIEDVSIDLTCPDGPTQQVYVRIHDDPDGQEEDAENFGKAGWSVELKS